MLTVKIKDFNFTFEKGFGSDPKRNTILQFPTFQQNPDLTQVASSRFFIAGFSSGKTIFLLILLKEEEVIRELLVDVVHGEEPLEAAAASTPPREVIVFYN